MPRWHEKASSPWRRFSWPRCRAAASAQKTPRRLHPGTLQTASTWQPLRVWQKTDAQSRSPSIHPPQRPPPRVFLANPNPKFTYLGRGCPSSAQTAEGSSLCSPGSPTCCCGSMEASCQEQHSDTPSHPTAFFKTSIIMNPLIVGLPCGPAPRRQ